VLSACSIVVCSESSCSKLSGLLLLFFFFCFERILSKIIFSGSHKKANTLSVFVSLWLFNIHLISKNESFLSIYLPIRHFSRVNMLAFLN
jgi:hypothetical protein